MALRDQHVLAALRNSVVIALVTTVIATAAGTGAALAFHRQAQHSARQLVRLNGPVAERFERQPRFVERCL